VHCCAMEMASPLFVFWSAIFIRLKSRKENRKTNVNSGIANLRINSSLVNFVTINSQC
jgi:L-cysteine desulfidase